jgi:RNA polymerase sigma-70 factor (ECF subfamily)
MDDPFERARGGDPAALAALVLALRPRLEKMAAFYARRCGEEPDDLLQEAWLGLLEALPSLDVRIGAPEQYLIRRAKWRLLDWIKRSRLRRCASLEEAAVETRVFPSEEVQEAVLVGAFLERLNPTQKKLLRCLLRGLTWRETGRVLGCTSANVAYHVRRIRRQYQDWSGEGPL